VKLMRIWVQIWIWMWMPQNPQPTMMSIWAVMMIWAFPLFGFAAERAGWLAAYAGASAVVLALLAGWLRADRRTRAAVA